MAARLIKTAAETRAVSGLDLDQVDGRAIPGKQDGRSAPGAAAADNQDVTNARHGKLLAAAVLDL